MRGWLIGIAGLAGIVAQQPGHAHEAQSKEEATETASKEADSKEAEAKRYEVRVEAEELEVNTRGTVALVVSPQNGFAIDRAFPSKLQFIPEVGDEVLVATKSEQGAGDARIEEGSLRWEVGITARKAGRHPARIKAEFRVCHGDDCTTGVSELRIHVVVKAS